MSGYRCAVCQSPVRLYPVRVRLVEGEMPAAGVMPARVAELRATYLRVVHPEVARAA